LWVAAIYKDREDDKPIGSGFVVDPKRVLTCAHVAPVAGDTYWIALPKAWESTNGRRFEAMSHPTPPALQKVRDITVLHLDEAVPAGLAAPLRRPEGRHLVGEKWWAFGFPENNALGNSADGAIVEELGEGWVRLDTDSRYHVIPGFSGAPVWSERFR
jgi:S1-C subfamily serine protease